MARNPSIMPIWRGACISQRRALDRPDDGCTYNDSPAVSPAPYTSMKNHLSPAVSLPRDFDRALLIGRVWMPAVNGPVLVQVKGDDVLELSALAPTCTHLLELPD